MSVKQAGPRLASWLRALLLAAVALVGLGLAFLVGRAGTPVWQAVRVLLVVVLVGPAAWEIRLCRPRRAGLLALVFGLAGSVVGLGIFPYHLEVLGYAPSALAGLACLVAGLFLLASGGFLLIRAARGWRRFLAVPAGLLLLLFVLYPLPFAVNVANRPANPLGPSTPADRALTYEEVQFTAADGVRLSGWYIPSTNEAAVLLLHGAGSTRSNVLDQAAVLVRHGYGALLLDGRGHGRSEGVSMDMGWYGALDIPAALSYLETRPDVDPARLAAVGLSMGGEEAVSVAGQDPRIRAVVGEGVTGMVAADHGWFPPVTGWLQQRIDSLMYGLSDLLSGAHPPLPLRDAVRAAAPRPVLLIAAGNKVDEGRAARFIEAAAPSTVRVWVAEGAGHTGALNAHPAEWESRVTGFLDEALGS